MLLYALSLLLFPIIIQSNIVAPKATPDAAIPDAAIPDAESLHQKIHNKDGLPLMLDLLRQHQRDADQTLQSFNDVLRRDGDWIVRDTNNKPLQSQKCLDAVETERRRFGIFVNDHLNDFEKCVDAFVDSYKAQILTVNIEDISTEAAKCISLTRMNVFWKEYKQLLDNGKQNCLSE